MPEKDTTKYVIQSSKISANLLTHILLTVFLGCFWLWPWVYKTTALLNNVKGLEFRKPSSKLALFILVPFYSVYWFRKTAKSIEFAAKQANEIISFAGICTFLAFFFPQIASILIQMEIEKNENVDELIAKRNMSQEEQASVPAPVVQQVAPITEPISRTIQTSKTDFMNSEADAINFINAKYSLQISIDDDYKTIQHKIGAVEEGGFMGIALRRKVLEATTKEEIIKIFIMHKVAYS